MGRAGVLRGRGQFRVVFAEGRRLRGRFLQASYVVSKRPGEPVRIGIAVAKRIAGAVVRNRIRRLIREAVRMELEPFRTALEQQGDCVDVVLSLIPARDLSLRRLSLHDFQPDVKKIFDTVTARLIRDQR